MKTRATWGKGKKYHEVKVPWGGSLFPAYHLNHSYVDCDVYVSLAKLKNHATAGVTMGIKNNFGITPPALYSSPRAQRASHIGPHGPLPQRQRAAGGRPSAGDRPEVAASADVPGPAAHGRLDRHPADRSHDHRRDRDGLRRRGAVAGAGLAEAGLAPGGPQSGLHRRRRHGRHGIRPDGRRRGPACSPATIIWPWPPSWDSGRTTRRRSRSWGCRSRTRCTPSAGYPREKRVSHTPAEGPSSARRVSHSPIDPIEFAPQPLPNATPASLFSSAWMSGPS